MEVIEEENTQTTYGVRQQGARDEDKNSCEDLEDDLVYDEDVEMNMLET